MRRLHICTSIQIIRKIALPLPFVFVFSLSIFSGGLGAANVYAQVFPPVNQFPPTNTAISPTITGTITTTGVRPAIATSTNNLSTFNFSTNTIIHTSNIICSSHRISITMVPINSSNSLWRYLFTFNSRRRFF